MASLSYKRPSHRHGALSGALRTCSQYGRKRYALSGALKILWPAEVDVRRHESFLKCLRHLSRKRYPRCSFRSPSRAFALTPPPHRHALSGAVTAVSGPFRLGTWSESHFSDPMSLHPGPGQGTLSGASTAFSDAAPDSEIGPLGVFIDLRGARCTRSPFRG